MQSFKQFLNETVENYTKLSDARKQELIKHHEELAKEHFRKSDEHKKVKPGEPKSLEHTIAADAHHDAGGLHSTVAYQLKNPPHGYDNTHDLKVRAERMSKGADGRSELANK